tara:strand:- start:3623 stop:3946 length:324 start_codon:yes stop_codon:yes gene_type:complete
MYFVKIKNKGLKFLLLHFSLVLLFAILYWLSEKFLINYPNITKKYDLGSAGYPATLYECFYFSLLTQTTIGYGVPENINDGKKNKLIQTVNIIQMISIFILLSITVV